MASKRQVDKSVQVGIMQINARHWRLRPEPDPAYLRQLSERMSVMLGLPLKVAKARVQQLAVSAAAGASLDGGGDARWWKAPRSKP